jgi:hypothetical protein
VAVDQVAAGVVAALQAEEASAGAAEGVLADEAEGEAVLATSGI